MDVAVFLSSLPRYWTPSIEVLCQPALETQDGIYNAFRVRTPAGIAGSQIQNPKTTEYELTCVCFAFFAEDFLGCWRDFHSMDLVLAAWIIPVVLSFTSPFGIAWFYVLLTGRHLDLELCTSMFP